MAGELIEHDNLIPTPTLNWSGRNSNGNTFYLYVIGYTWQLRVEGNINCDNFTLTVSYASGDSWTEVGSYNGNPNFIYYTKGLLFNSNNASGSEPFSADWDWANINTINGYLWQIKIANLTTTGSLSVLVDNTTNSKYNSDHAAGEVLYLYAPRDSVVKRSGSELKPSQIIRRKKGVSLSDTDDTSGYLIGNIEVGNA